MSLEITVKRGPEDCPHCGRPLLHDQAATACEACAGRSHTTCWEERGGCAACAPQEAAGGEAASAAGEPDAEQAPGDGHGHGHGLPPGEEPRWLDHPENVTKLARGVYALGAALLVFEALSLADVLYHKHVHEGFDWEGWPGFYPFYGFLAYSLVVILGMGLQKLVMRGEDYYGDA